MKKILLTLAALTFCAPAFSQLMVAGVGAYETWTVEQLESAIKNGEHALAQKKGYEACMKSKACGMMRPVMIDLAPSPEQLQKMKEALAKKKEGSEADPVVHGVSKSQCAKFNGTWSTQYGCIITD